MDCSSDSVPVTDSSNDECENELQGSTSPLYFLYDCESTGGSIYEDHIVEIAAVLQPLNNNVDTHLEKSFHSLVNTSRRTAAPVLKKCGIKQTDLIQQSKLSVVLPRFVSWLTKLTEEVSAKTNKKYFPVLLAQSGFAFDFPLLYAEIERRNSLLTTKLLDHIFFGDPLFTLRALRSQGKLPLDKRQKLGMQELHALYFPNAQFKAHRALADAEAMRDVLFCTQLKDINDQHQHFLRNSLEQENEYKSMVKIRERTKSLQQNLGSAISGSMVKKIATAGFDFIQLKNLQATFPERDKFSKFLKSKGLSSKCSQKLAAYFFQP